MKPLDEAMLIAADKAGCEAALDLMVAGFDPKRPAGDQMRVARTLGTLRALDAAGYELRAKLSEDASRKLVQALWDAAFRQGELEHRESVSDATLKKNSAAVQAARAALMSALAAAPKPCGAGPTEGGGG